jgi:hypothetical protein
MRTLYAAIGIAGLCCACSNDITPPADVPASSSPAPTAPDAAVTKLVVAYANQLSGSRPMYEWTAAGLWSGIGQHFGPNATYGILSGRVWRWSSTLKAGTDASGVQSPAGVVTYTWPAGLKPGNSAGIGWEAWADDAHTQKTHYYESFVFRIPQPTLEIHGPSGGMKLFGYWAVGQTGAANNQVIGWIATPGGNPASAFRIEIRQQNVKTRNLAQNVDRTPYLTTQAWHQVEFQFVANTIGSANGICRVWIDGHKIIDYSDVTWRTSTYPAAFFDRKYDPIWGGNGGGNKTMTNTMELDHIYASGW